MPKVLHSETVETGTKMASTLQVVESDTGAISLERIVDRNNIRNVCYTFDDGENAEIRTPLNFDRALTMIEKLKNGSLSWSDTFVEGNVDSTEISWVRTEKEHAYTSTGIKFWRHQEAMENFRAGVGNTVVSTHISPEGMCNLKCAYCSVTYRDTASRIPLDRIKKYVIQLKERGLKAVILTGGGEPTLYPHFSELVLWLKNEMNLSIGLITNGTQTRRISDEAAKTFSWVRVSINIFNGWEKVIKLDKTRFSEDCVIGCSFVYTSENTGADLSSLEDTFKKVAGVATAVGADYVRVLPNCLLTQDNLLAQHRNLKKIFETLEDKRFFHQFKVHETPGSSECHQAYFRPYLSEEPWTDGEPGTVFPCDSVVLNNSYAHFNDEYKLCKLEDVGDFIDRKILMKFSPKEKCKGCVFTSNVNMLESWKSDGISKFEEFNIPLKHEEFI